MQHFKFMPDIDTAPYTNYFLNEFIEETNFNGRIINQDYVMFKTHELNTPIINGLNNYLMSTFNFPSFEYAIIFKHFKTQPIHVDGHHAAVRQASLNLPLIGYENTKMVFYKLNIDIKDVTATDAFYIPLDKVTYDSELQGSNDWILVNSSVPHHIVNADENKPRLTMCLRFRGNPTYKTLTDLVNSRMATTY